MKSMFIAICMMVSFLSQTAKAAEPTVSPRIVRAFETTYTEAEDAQWSVVENLFKVTFTVEDRRMFAFFNAQGEIVVAGKYLTVKQLPKGAQKKLAETANGYTISEVFEITEGLNSKYYVSLTNGSERRIMESTGGKWTAFNKKNSK